MGNRRPLTLAEKERIYKGKLQGLSLSELAAEVGCSVHCARKWWRRGRNQGLEGLRAPRKVRGPTGTLSQFAPRVAEEALALKRGHPGWGADRVLVELRRNEEFNDLRLPGPSRLAHFFKERCPECVASRKPRKEQPKRPPIATGVHEIWQLDNQEGIRLADSEIATICNIRDPFGAAMIASCAFSVKTKRHWRKLEWTEVRGVLRASFTEWHTLPDAVMTDNELALVGSPNDPFPGKLTLWLAGLGIRHLFIRPGCPTDQPQIERNHRSLNGFAHNEESLKDLVHLQKALDRERNTYNHDFPCRASDCTGQPPITAHPELLRPRRPYQPDQELALFDIQRVYDHLATFTFERKPNTSAQVSLGGKLYSIGQKLVREREVQTVRVRLDPGQKEWIFELEDGEELVRRPLKGLDAQTLTGLDPADLQPSESVQLTLPFFIA
jgi:transposase